MASSTGIAIGDTVAAANRGVFHRTHARWIDLLWVNALTAFPKGKKLHASPFGFALVAVSRAIAATNWLVDFCTSPV